MKKNYTTDYWERGGGNIEFKQERRVLASSLPHHWITQGVGGNPDGAEKGGSRVYNYHEWRTARLFMRHAANQWLGSDKPGENDPYQAGLWPASPNSQISYLATRCKLVIRDGIINK